ncbi:TPA: hypothetical protein ACS7ZY_002839 [Providencia alcalifaciens]
MIKYINQISKNITNINDNKMTAASSLSNEIKKTNNISSCVPNNSRLSNLNYQKKHFAVSTCHFEPSEQREINLIKYSPPAEKITLPYKYHEFNEANSHFFTLYQPHILNHQTSMEKNLFISKQKETDMTLINKASDQQVNSFKDFKLNRSSSRFSNLILEIKSTHEKGIRYLKNIFNKNKNEKFCVAFKKVIETPIKHEETRASEVITYQNTASTQKVENNLNTLKSSQATLAEQLKKIETDKKNEIKADEERIRKEAESYMIQNTSMSKIKDENKTKSSNTEFEFNDELEWSDETNNIQDSLQEKITGRLVSLAIPSTHHLDKLLVDETDMKPINRLLKDMDSLNEREIKLSSSNESLNSNSSSYFSETTDESGYSSEETTKIHVKNDHITTQKNKKLKNKETENTETPQKKTHFVVKPKKKTYQFDGKIYQTKTSMLRAKHNSEKYQFSLNGNSPETASIQGKTETNNLDAMLKKIQVTLHDIDNLGEQIVKEEAHSAMIQMKLAKHK